VDHQIALIHELPGPHASKKLVLGDDDAWAFDERKENLPRSASEWDRGLSIEEKVLVGKQTDGPKRELTCAGVRVQR
jgi:hypothetical protein